MTEPESGRLWKTIGLQAKEIEKLQQELGRRDAYVHELHLAREADWKELRQARADLEEFTWWLGAAENERDATKQRFAASARKQKRGLAAWLSGNQEKSAPPPPASAVDVPAAPFAYFLRTTPFRVYREPVFTLEGWAFPQDGRAVTAIRARVDDREFPGICGLEEPEVVARHGPLPNNPRPGFKIAIEIPPGRHRLSLEARLGEGGWVSFLTAPVWSKTANR